MVHPKPKDALFPSTWMIKLGLQSADNLLYASTKAWQD